MPQQGLNDQLAIFIDGPAIGEMRRLPGTLPSYEVFTHDTNYALTLTENPVPAGITVRTVTYRPVMAGVGSRVAFWSCASEELAIDALLKLIEPPLAVIRNAAHAAQGGW